MSEQFQPSYHPTQLQMHLHSLLFFQKDRLETVRHLCTLWNILRRWSTTSLGTWDMPCSHHTWQPNTCHAMKPLTYATENRSMTTSFTSRCTSSTMREPLRPSWRVSLPWLADGIGREALHSLSNECKLSRSSVYHSHSLHYAYLLRKAFDDTILQGIYKLSHSWVIIRTTARSDCIILTPRWLQAQQPQVKTLFPWRFTRRCDVTEMTQ